MSGGEGPRLRTRLSFGLLAMGLVPLTVATVVLSLFNLDRLERSAKEYRLTAADVGVHAVRGLLQRARAELRAVGAALGERGTSAAERRRIAEARLLGGELVEMVALYDAEGRYVLSLRVAADGRRPAPSSRPGQQTPEVSAAGLSRPRSLAETPRRAASGEGWIHLGVSRGADGRYYMPTVVPIRRGEEGGAYGFLWCPVALAPLDAAIGGLSKRHFAQRADRAFIVDQALKVVAHSDPAQLGQTVAGIPAEAKVAARQNVAFSSEYERGGELLLGALVPIPDLGLAVVVEQSRAAAYEAARRTWQTGLVIGAAFALIAIVIGLLVGRRLAAPVTSVASAAERVASGDFSARVEPVGAREMRELGRSFNRMAGDLERYEARIVDETRIRSDLSRYLSAELVEQVVDGEAQLNLGGERREVTVLFADVVAFTPLAEEHEPERIVALLNELFSLLTELVFKHGGTVDKFIGDCVMAVFGAPYAHDDDPLRAVRAAEEMMRWVEAGNAKWRLDLGREMQLGIGIHTGEVVVGNIGSEKRMEYTVIGDAVNIAARLETLAQPGQVLMTSATSARVASEFDCSSLGRHELSGRQEKTEIFELERD